MSRLPESVTSGSAAALLTSAVAPEWQALDEAVRALERGETGLEHIVGSFRTAIDRHGVPAIERYLQSLGSQASTAVKEAFRRASLRLQRDLWGRRVEAEIVFAPLLLRGEDARVFPSEINAGIGRSLADAIGADLRELGRTDVVVVPLSALYTEAELRAQPPSFFHRVLQTVFATCESNGPGSPPQILRITKRNQLPDAECTDLQERAPYTERFLTTVRAPKITVRLLALAVLRDPAQALPANLAAPRWRATAAEEIAALARFAERTTAPPVRRLPLPPHRELPQVELDDTLRVDVMPPLSLWQATAAGRVALTLEVVSHDAAHWLAAAPGPGVAAIAFDAVAGTATLRYAIAGRSGPAIEFALQLDSGHVGWQAVERLRDDLLGHGFAEVTLAYAGHNDAAPPAYLTPRAPARRLLH